MRLLGRAGPGVPLATPVSAWRPGASSVARLRSIGFAPFSSLESGVMVALGDVDRQGRAELVAAPGAGLIGQGARVRGFDLSGDAASALRGLDVAAYATLYGGNVGVAEAAGVGVKVGCGIRSTWLTLRSQFAFSEFSRMMSCGWILKANAMPPQVSFSCTV